MLVHQLYTANDLRNFTYLLEREDGQCWCVDPWDADQVLAFLATKQLALKVILNTHEHFDHVRGNEKLVKQTGAQVWCHAQAIERIPEATVGLRPLEILPFEENWDLQVLDTPGHTMASLCFLVREQGKGKALLSGDTLFNAGVGNCHNGGDPSTLYETITRLILPLADDVLVYPGHDYLINNLRFTLHYESNNQQAQDYLKRFEVAHQEALKFYVTTMREERSFNSFFRLSSPALRHSLGLSQQNSDEEVFIHLRKVRNQW
jgi:hydroxyacylglutathione hydrolase